jgi:hypothetical protein
MEHLDTLFGPLHMTKVTTANVESVGKVQDIYMAKIKPATTDATIAMAMTDHVEGRGGLVLLRELPWNVLSVRTYPSHQVLADAVHKIITRQNLEKLSTQYLPELRLGDEKDMDLTTLESFREYAIYHSSKEIPFMVALHANGKDDDLLQTVEFIPALTTLNFTLTKK